jgi:hypothetical protein
MASSTYNENTSQSRIETLPASSENEIVARFELIRSVDSMKLKATDSTLG